MGRNTRKPITAERILGMAEFAAEFIDSMEDVQLDEYVGSGKFFSLYALGLNGTRRSASVLTAYRRMRDTHGGYGPGSYGSFLDTTFALSAGHDVSPVLMAGLVTPREVSTPDGYDKHTSEPWESKTSVRAWQSKDEGGTVQHAQFNFADAQLAPESARNVFLTHLTIPRQGPVKHLFAACSKEVVLGIKKAHDDRRAKSARERVSSGYNLSFPVREDGTLNTDRSLSAQKISKYVTDSASKHRKQIGELLHG